MIEKFKYKDGEANGLTIAKKLNEIIDVLNSKPECGEKCEHDWEYSSPPHRDQRCKKCKEHRIEPECGEKEMKKDELEELISPYVLPWSKKVVANVIRIWIEQNLPEKIKDASMRCGWEQEIVKKYSADKIILTAQELRDIITAHCDSKPECGEAEKLTEAYNKAVANGESNMFNPKRVER